MAPRDTEHPADETLQLLPPIIGALVAGVAYIAAQTLFAALRGESGGAPMQRIAAILLGPDAAPPQDTLTFTAAGMAVLIHLPLAFIYARVLDKLVRGLAPALATLVGAVFGIVAVYLPNFYLIAPDAFPWFIDVRNTATFLDHLVFGGLTALVCVLARSWLDAAFSARSRIDAR